jgi:hypothetical protein
MLGLSGKTRPHVLKLSSTNPPFLPFGYLSQNMMKCSEAKQTSELLVKPTFSNWPSYEPAPIYRHHSAFLPVLIVHNPAAQLSELGAMSRHLNVLLLS